jgi:hypothetical protein
MVLSLNVSMEEMTMFIVDNASFEFHGGRTP